MWTERILNIDIEKGAKLHAAVTKSDIYFYQFGYESRHSLKKFLSNDYYKGKLKMN